MDLISVIIGIAIGVVFAPLLIKLAKIGWAKLEALIGKLKKWRFYKQNLLRRKIKIFIIC